ncbi:MAG: tetratricopeptide repeat protein [Muribaculaceae bacterium]|nr:tetratricopeptide repeat protein [Muribaculaceae bacterium]
MKYRIIILTTCLVCAMSAAFAGSKKEKKSEEFSYNEQRGIEAMNDGNYEEGIEFFKKELSDNPESGRAHTFLATAYLTNENLDLSLSEANKALRFLSNKETTMLVGAHSIRAKIHLYLGDTIQALKDYEQALKVDPKDEDTYSYRAQIYYEQKKYDLAQADYNTMIKLNPKGVEGYMGLARNCNDLKQYDKALEYCNKVVDLTDDDYSQVYTYRATAYKGLNNWEKASADIVHALDIDKEQDAIGLVRTSHPEGFKHLEKLLTEKATQHSDDIMWNYLLACLYDTNYMFGKAVEKYNEVNKVDPMTTIEYNIAFTLCQQGKHDEAEEHMRKAIAMDTTDNDLVLNLSELLYYAKKYDQAIEVANTYLELEPDDVTAYSHRGLCEMKAGNYEKALKDINMSIDISAQSENPYSYLLRAKCYQKLGNNELAQADLKHIIELDSVPSEDSLTPQAYFYLGDKDKTMAENQACLDAAANDGDDDTSGLYNSACIYALMGDTDTALAQLRQLLAMGGGKLFVIENDSDFDILHDLPAYKALMQEYRNK